MDTGKDAEQIVKAKIGIIALIDEATGYQEVRPKDELQKKYEEYTREELNKRGIGN